MKSLRKDVWYKTIFMSLALFFFAACEKETSSSEIISSSPEKEELNIQYGSHPLQKMDVYFPENYTESTPVVFLIHGGGFIAGSKEDFTTQSKLFRKENFIVVNLSHRLIDTSGLLSLPPVHKASAIKVSDQLADVDAAIKKYETLAAEWKSSTSNMYMAGHSAGAILALLYSEGEYNADKKIRAAGNWAGSTDLSLPHDSLLASLDPRYKELMYRTTGATFSTSNNLYFMAISPFWVANNRGETAVISIYPEDNVVIGINGEADFGLLATQKFHQLLKNKGIAEKLSVYAGSDHGFGRPEGTWNKLIKETAAFFNKNK